MQYNSNTCIIILILNFFYDKLTLHFVLQFSKIIYIGYADLLVVYASKEEALVLYRAQKSNLVPAARKRSWRHVEGYSI